MKARTWAIYPTREMAEDRKRWIDLNDSMFIEQREDGRWALRYWAA